MLAVRRLDRLGRLAGGIFFVLLAVVPTVVGALTGWGIFVSVVCFVAAVALVHAPCASCASCTTRIPVLAYHSVHPDAFWMGAPDLVVSPRLFSRQMHWLRRKGYTALTMPQLYEARTSGARGRFVGIHFDDGYKDTLTNALPVLAEQGMTGTVFVAPGLLAEYLPRRFDPLQGLEKGFMSRDDVAGLAGDSALEVQSHAWSHTPMSRLDSAQRRREMRESKAFLEGLVQGPVEHLCFPRDVCSGPVRREAASVGYLSCTGGGGYNTGRNPEQVGRIYITASGNDRLDMLRFVLEIKVFQGWYWLFPALWFLQKATRRSWKHNTRTRRTP